jgi:D-alanyl-D-alanine carboxypeptidase
MRPGRRRPSVAGSVVVLAAVLGGAVAGGMLGLLGRGSAAPRAAASATVAPAVRLARATTLLVWTPGGLPSGFAARVARLPAVEHVVPVVSGTLWLSKAYAPDGTLVFAAPRRFGEPVEVAGAALAGYAPFLSPPNRSILPSLADGEAAVGTTAASVLDLRAGSVAQLGSARLRVSGVLPDAAIGANGLFVSQRTARALGIERQRYLLVAPGARASRERLTAAIRGLLPVGTPAQIRGPGETPYFRQGDAVLPTVMLEELFGGFAARVLPGHGLAIDPAWVRAHIVAAHVPVLGWVRCNRAVIPQLVGAFREIEQEGLAHLIDRAGYGGCYRPELLRPTDPQAGVSHHTWGIAININLSNNRLGSTPHQDPRLVAILERWGFTWGGGWLVPFGAQFEVIRLRGSA